MALKILCESCSHPLISVLMIRNVPNDVETAAETCLESAIFGAAAVCRPISSIPNIQLMLSWTWICSSARKAAGCYREKLLCSQLLHMKSLLSNLGLFCFPDTFSWVWCGGVFLGGFFFGGGCWLAFVWFCFLSFFPLITMTTEGQLFIRLKDQCRKTENHDILWVGCE